MPIADILGAQAQSTGEELGSGALGRLWLGKEPGALQLEVQEFVVGRRPTTQAMRKAWATRRKLRGNPVIIFWEGSDGTALLCGPIAEEEQKVSVAELPATAAATILRLVLAAPRATAVPMLLDLLDRAQGSGAAPGFRNRGLVSTHCTLVGFRRNEQRWKRLAERSESVKGTAGVEFLRALGYEKVVKPGTFVHESAGRVVVYATSLAPGISIDRSDGATGRTAAAELLALARDCGARRAVIVMGRVVRTYVVDRDDAGDDISTPATYVELDLDLLDETQRPLIPLFAGTQELSENGAFQQLLEESRRYAVALRERFARSVYDEVVGSLVSAIYNASPTEERGNTRSLFGAALLLLYRLLFVLYAEDRNLLPLGNSEYRENSLTTLLFTLREYARSGKAWDTKATDRWSRLRSIFRGIAGGQTEWNLPEYDGGLFARKHDGIPGATLLDDIALPNAALAPILLRLTFDRETDDAEPGKIDFSDLGIRYLGTLYEGLLSYDVRFAERDLSLAGDEYVAATKGHEVTVQRGEPYLITPQGGRKVSGTYFTPSFVVRRLIDEALMPTLDAHLARVGDLSPESAFAAMLEFRVVDPAMGSGHFLIDALDEIADRMNVFLREHPAITAKPLAEAREHVTEMGKRFGIEQAGERVGDFELLRRIVLKHCIYGVDLAPMATELAMLGLWLHAFVPALPLSYLGHTLRHGNSLLGVVGTELDDRFGDKLFWSGIRSKLDEALRPAREIAARGDLSLRDVEESERLQRELEGGLAPLRRAYDAYAARAFAQEARGPLEESLLGEIVSATPLGSIERRIEGTMKLERIPLDALVDAAARAAEDLDAFHWELAYPEVFAGEFPGFHVVLGNPPWEEVTVERLGFYARYIPGIKSLRSQREQEQQIVAYERQHPDVKLAFEHELQSKERIRELIHSNFTLSRGSDPDLYRAFAELAVRISRKDGAIGMVYPRVLLAAQGSALYRKELFPRATIVADFALNRGGWMFPDAHPQYTIVALAARKDGGGHIDTAGPVVGEKAWSALPALRTHWQYTELEKASPGLEVPLIPDARYAQLFKKMIAIGQQFSAPVSSVTFRPWAPIHATNDRKSGLLQQRGRGVRGWPVYGGRNFDLWTPEIGETDFVLDPKEGLAMLQRKRLRGDVWKGTEPGVLKDPGTLPPMNCSMLFRDVTNRTNSRTIIACLVPPERFAANQAPTLVQIGGAESDSALRLAVMCSLPFDWAARRRVEMHINFFILEALPVPNIAADAPLGKRIVELAARLACIDSRFKAFAKACGVATGSLNDSALRDEAIAELDALVAATYGLDAGDLEVIFDDFTLDAVPDVRRIAVRKHFSALLEAMDTDVR